MIFIIILKKLITIIFIWLVNSIYDLCVRKEANAENTIFEVSMVWNIVRTTLLLFRMIFVACHKNDGKSSYEDWKSGYGGHNKHFFWKCGLTPPTQFPFDVKPHQKNF